MGVWGSVGRQGICHVSFRGIQMGYMDPTILSRAMIEICYNAICGFILGVWITLPLLIIIFVYWVLTRDNSENPNNPD